MAIMSRNGVLAACVLLAIVAGTAAQTFSFAPAGGTTSSSGTTTESDKTSSTKLKAMACASVKTKSIKGGFAYGWANSNAQGINAAAAVCATATATAFADVCTGSFALGAVTAAAETCASATAKVYVSSMYRSTTSGNAKACTDTCAMAEGAARAVATAAATGILEAASNCSAVAAFVNSTAWSTAIVDATAQTLLKVCGQGESKIWTQANSMASGLASSYAKTFAAAMAKACTSCSTTCKCPPLPDKAALEDLATSDTYSSVAAGRRALTQSMANAAAKFCDGSTVEASVKAVAESVVKLYTAALVKTQTVLKVQGNGKGCVKAKAKLDVTGVSRAVGEATAAAFAQFSACQPVASMANTTNSVFVEQLSTLLFNSTSESCTSHGVVNTTLIESQITSPSGRVARALTTVFATLKNKCACKGSCWCATTCEAASYCPTFALTGYGGSMG